MISEERFEEHKKAIFKRINSLRKEVKDLQNKVKELKKLKAECYKKWQAALERGDKFEEESYSYNQIVYFLNKLKSKK